MAGFTEPPKTTDPLEILRYYQHQTYTPKSEQTGIASKPVTDDRTSGVMKFFADWWTESQEKVAKAREEIAPEMEEIAKTSADKAIAERNKMGKTDSRETAGDLITQDLLAREKARLAALAEQEATRETIISTAEPSDDIMPDSKDEQEAAPVTVAPDAIDAAVAEALEEPAATEGGGLMSRRLDEKGKALPITELRNYTDNYAEVYLTEHEGLKPHKSLEGGKDTAALGVKFSLGLKRSDYKSDSEFAGAVALKHRDKAKAKFGEDKWDNLPESVKFAMTDLNYNTGTIGSSGDKEDTTAAMKNTLDFVGMTTKAGEKASLISLAKRRAWNWNKAASDIGESEIAKIKQIPTSTGGTKFEYLDEDDNVIYSTTTTRKPVKLDNSGKATVLTTTREMDM